MKQHNEHTSFQTGLEGNIVQKKFRAMRKDLRYKSLWVQAAMGVHAIHLHSKVEHCLWELHAC